jgi:DNA transformation protein
VAEDIERISELFESYGPVVVRRMFSGAGVFVDGLMIALSVRGVIYFKADDTTIPDFQREGREPFQYKSRDGKRTLNSYWRMPERLYDDPDELAQWARRAAECARRAGARGRTKGRARKPAAKAVAGGRREPKRP